jgi:hypothetical protein
VRRHPVLYVEENAGLFGIPWIYILAIDLILIASLLAIVAVGGVAQMRATWQYRDLFLLGAAFLLLETKNVTGFALYFGTTWLVNAFVFAGILLAVFAAVGTFRRATSALDVRHPIRRSISGVEHTCFMGSCRCHSGSGS